MKKVNGIEITAKTFAYDDCHKIYLIESDADMRKAVEYLYNIYPIEELKQAFENSCGLQFISNMSLTKQIVPQFEDANFEGF